MIEVIITAVGASLIAVIGNVIMFKLQRKANKEDKSDLNVREEIEAIKQENKKQNEDNLLLRNGVLALLKDRLFQSCQHYLSVGNMTVDEMEVLTSTYKNYRNLGGNGVGQKLYEAVQLMFAGQEWDKV